MRTHTGKRPLNLASFQTTQPGSGCNGRSTYQGQGDSRNSIRCPEGDSCRSFSGRTNVSRQRGMLSYSIERFVGFCEKSCAISGDVPRGYVLNLVGRVVFDFLLRDHVLSFLFYTLSRRFFAPVWSSWCCVFRNPNLTVANGAVLPQRNPNPDEEANFSIERGRILFAHH